MTAGTLSADTFSINVDFGRGFTGTGSFNTDGTCGICSAFLGQLTNFTFTVDDDTFDEVAAATGGLAYNRDLNVLQGQALEGDARGENLVFAGVAVGTTAISFADADDAPSTAFATGTVSLTPEPSSLVLLAGGIGLLAFGLTRRRSARMRGGIR